MHILEVSGRVGATYVEGVMTARSEERELGKKKYFHELLVLFHTQLDILQYSLMLTTQI